MNDSSYSQYQVHSSPVTAFDVSATETFAFAGFSDGKIKHLSLNELLNDNSLNLMNTISLSSRNINGLHFSKMHVSEFVVASENAIFCYDFVKKENLRKYYDSKKWIVNNDANYLANNVLASISNDGSLKLYDCSSSSQKPIQTFNNSPNSLTCFDFNPNRYWLISCGTEDGKFYNYDLRMEKLIVDDFSKIIGNPKFSPITSLKLSSAGRGTGKRIYSQNALVGSLNNPLMLMDLNLDKSDGESNFISNYNEKILSSGEEKNARLYINKFYKKKLIEKDYKITSNFFNSDRNIISGSITGEVYLWSTNEQKSKVLKTHNSYTTLDGTSNNLISHPFYLELTRSVIAGSADGKFHLWEDVVL